ncbi:MAG: 4Fe-4S binding protein [Chlorobiales bacterium]|nr:4Fe-4S binding protein [Chlorobiales bacterium]
MNLYLRRTVRLADPRPEPTAADLSLPERLFIPLRQHSGPAAEAIVEPDQVVSEGELIGRPDPEEFESAPVHAPCPGKVVRLVNKPLIGGQTGPCVELEPTGPPSEVPGELPQSHHEPDPGQIFGRLAAAGVVASGIQALPVIRDMTPYDQDRFLDRPEGTEVKSIYTLIVSGVDREPGLAHQRHLAQANHPALSRGINAIHTLSGAAKTVVVGDSRGGEARSLAGLLDHGLRSAMTVDGGLYPNGLKPVLIKTVTGDETPLPLGDPREVGAFFVRLETAYWVGLAVALGRPQTGKWITVTSPDGRCRVMCVMLGTPVGHILENLGVSPAQGGKVIIGGMLSGYTIYDLQTPITKQMGGVVVLDPDQVVRFEPQPCIGCGLCARVCPTRLVPGMLSKYCEYGRFEAAEESNLAHCIECGLCAYVCPAKRPMVHYFRHAKEELLAGRTAQ